MKGAVKKGVLIKAACALLIAVYSAFMLYLLFFRSRIAAFSKPVIFGKDIKLIPFRTTYEFIEILLSPPDSAAFWHGIRNLAGNIVLFVPYGFFLPFFFEKCRGYCRTLLFSGLGIIAIELAQLLTRRGTCDIDDLIFNLAGVSLGFALFVLWQKLSGRRKVPADTRFQKTPVSNDK